MGHQMRDSFCAHKDLPHFAQLLFGLFKCHKVKSKVTLSLNIILKTAREPGGNIFSSPRTSNPVVTRFCYQMVAVYQYHETMSFLFNKGIKESINVLKCWQNINAFKIPLVEKIRKIKRGINGTTSCSLLLVQLPFSLVGFCPLWEWSCAVEYSYI